MQPKLIYTLLTMNNSGKRKYVFLHWKRLAWQSALDFLQWSILVITVIGSLIAFLPTDRAMWLKAAIPYYISTYPGIFVLLVLFLISIAIHWPRTRAAYKDKKTDIWVILECCDILQQKGLKVIHTVDTFDTELERIISPKSLYTEYSFSYANKRT